MQEIVALARRTRLLAAVAPAQREGSGHGTLTEREHEVFEQICTGATNRRIAQQLFISEKTVSIHVSRILAKLGATNRGEAASIAYRMGLL